MDNRGEKTANDDSMVAADSVSTIHPPFDRRLRLTSGPFEDPVPAEHPEGRVDPPKPSTAKESDSSPTPYDPYDYGNVDHATSFWDTVIHMMIVIAGPSVVSLPSVSVAAGYAVATILVPVLFGLYVHSMHLLLWCEYQLCRLKRVPALSYTEVAYHAFKEGPLCGRWFAQWSKWLSSANFMCVWSAFYCYNLVIVSKNLHILLRDMFRSQMAVRTFLLLLLVPSLLLALIPKLKWLVPFSLFGCVFNAASLLVVVYFVGRDPAPWRPPSPLGQPWNVPLFMGTVLVNMNVTGLLIPLRHEMKEPRKLASRFGALAVAYAPTSVLYVLFSLVCALRYGSGVRPSIVDNLPPNDPLAQIGVCFSSLALLCQQPVTLQVMYEITWNQTLKNRIRSRHPNVWANSVRLSLVAAAFAVTLAVPDEFLFLSVSGTVGTSVDSFVVPALMHTAVVWRVCANTRRFRLAFAKNMVIVGVAAFLVVTGVVDCVSLIKNQYSNENLPHR